MTTETIYRITCDRCKTPLESKKDEPWNGWWNLHFRHLGAADSGVKYDFCPSCAESFTSWRNAVEAELSLRKPRKRAEGSVE